MAKIPPPKKRKGPPPAMVQTVGNLDKTEPNDYSPLNFKVAPDFKREFKSYAARHGLSMIKLLQEGFVLVKTQRGN